MTSPIFGNVEGTIMRRFKRHPKALPLNPEYIGLVSKITRGGASPLKQAVDSVVELYGPAQEAVQVLCGALDCPKNGVDTYSMVDQCIVTKGGGLANPEMADGMTIVIEESYEIDDKGMLRVTADFMQNPGEMVDIEGSRLIKKLRHLPTDSVELLMSRLGSLTVQFSEDGLDVTVTGELEKDKEILAALKRLEIARRIKNEIIEEEDGQK